MKKLFSNTAISLLELIIASVLVVVMVLGFFAVNQVLSGNNMDYGQKYLVKSATQTTLSHILNNAALAVGTGTTITSGLNSIPDQGIVIGNDSTEGWTTDSNSFCIHQDINPATQALDSTTVNVPPSTSPSYPNSRWLCYTWYPLYSATPGSGNTYGSTYNYTIYYCAYTYSQNSSYRGAYSCNPTSAFSANTGPTYLGNAFSISPSFTFGPVEPSSFASLGLSSAEQTTLFNNLEVNNYIVQAGSVSTMGTITSTFTSLSSYSSMTINTGDPTIDNQKQNIYNKMVASANMLFSITINNCLKDSDTTNCQSSGVSASPSTNPEVQLTGSITPSQEGAQQP